jgi:hypothetical protein
MDDLQVDRDLAVERFNLGGDAARVEITWAVGNV